MSDWTAKLRDALAPPPEKPEKGYEPLEVWMDRFNLGSRSNAFLTLRELVGLKKMSRAKHRVTNDGRVSYRSFWKWNA